MTFTKTSQKFGQWSDIRANTVYGLGFATEGDLNKFIEKFQEMKEATRNAAHQKAQLNGSTNCMNNGGDRDPNERNDSLHHPEMSIFKSQLSHQRSQSLSHLQATKVSDAFCFLSSFSKQIFLLLGNERWHKKSHPRQNGINSTFPFIINGSTASL